MASLSQPRPIIITSQPLDGTRTGSILLNPDGGPVADNTRRRSWNGTGPLVSVTTAAVAIFTTTATDGPQAAAAPSGIERGRPAAINTSRTAPSRSPTDGSSGGLTTDGGVPTAVSPRIRFAPLPDPHSKPRSLSTGRNLGLVAAEGPDGERQYSVELKDYDEHALDDEDDDSGEDSGDSGRRRSWMGMGSMTKATKSSWKGTKKLLGKPTKESSGDEMGGAPLKKSVSASGLMGTSPFRLAEPDKKKNLLSTSPSSSIFASAMGGRRPSASIPMPTHTRGGSGDAGTPKVRMLNGRVYGARRASEAAAAEQMRRLRMEPEFVEWGSGHGAVPAAAQPASVGSRSRSNNPDDDDGGGMAWVRKRREERERKEREEKERRESAATDESDTAAAAATLAAAPVTDDSQNLQASPSEQPVSLSSSASSSPAPVNGPLTPHEPPNDLGQFPPTVLVSAPGSAPIPRHRQPTPKGENDHVVRAVAMPASEKHTFVSEADGQDGHDVDSPAEEEDEEEEEDDGDWDCDDEEEDEEEVGVNRFTCSAAGVEVISRHRQTA